MHDTTLLSLNGKKLPRMHGTLGYMGSSDLPRKLFAIVRSWLTSPLSGTRSWWTVLDDSSTSETFCHLPMSVTHQHPPQKILDQKLKLHGFIFSPLNSQKMGLVSDSRLIKCLHSDKVDNQR